MPKIYVVDSIMGSGKTSAAINKINEDTETNYIFITPFLAEVNRIKENCSVRMFIEPEHKSDGKLIDLKTLLDKRNNIASTHALFKWYDTEVIQKIKEGDYALILDEVFNVLEPYNISKYDMKMLLDTKTISIGEDNYIIWNKPDYRGDFEPLKSIALTNNLLYINDCLFFWIFPHDIFKCFKEVYILTYMFDAQIQKYYYDMNNIKFEYLHVDSTYHFSKTPYIPLYVKQLVNKIHIIESKTLNNVGSTPYSALSVTWYDKQDKERTKINRENKYKSEKAISKLDELKNNIYNAFNNYFKCLNNEFNMWTTFSNYEGLLSGRGYKKAFVSVNARSTNDHRYRKNLAYCANIFLNPHVKKYFQDKGINVLEEKYALSELLQWIWRSAIREGNDINIYIPSVRMRSLLTDYLKEVSK